MSAARSPGSPHGLMTAQATLRVSCCFLSDELACSAYPRNIITLYILLVISNKQKDGRYFLIDTPTTATTAVGFERRVDATGLING